MRQTTTTTTAVVILSCFFFSGEQSCDAFQQQQNRRTTATRTALQLVPEQGNQLAAAYNAALDHKESIVEDEEQQDNTSHWRAISTSKSFLNRLFHKPSAPESTTQEEENNNHSKFQLGTFLHNLSHPNLHIHNKAKVDEVYLYPIVGFQFVEGCQDALPTLSHVSCRMPTKSQKEEEVVGWYTTCCKLDLYSDDVCHSPVPVPIVEESPEEELALL